MGRAKPVPETLDCRRQQTSHADAVAAHYDGVLLSLRVQEIRAQGLAEERPQLEDMSHLDALGGVQYVPAAGA